MSGTKLDSRSEPHAVYGVNAMDGIDQRHGLRAGSERTIQLKVTIRKEKINGTSGRTRTGTPEGKGF